MNPVSQHGMESIHPYIPELYAQWQQGRVSRRTFIRGASLLGLSVGAAVAAACTPDQSPVSQATPTQRAIKRGGSWRCAMPIHALEHPARITSIEASNLVRHVGEYLTQTDANNITHPLLLSRWEASEDAKVWTLHLRQGITFNNGDALTSEDVLFTFKQWLDPSLGSSMLGLLTYIKSSDDIEKIDDYTLRLYLQKPTITLPEQLFHYPAIILHRSFEGDFTQQPIGTGPYLLEHYAVGEQAQFRRRHDYWRPGGDGQPLPYLDQLSYRAMDRETAIAAIQTAEIDTFHQPLLADWLQLQDYPDLRLQSVATANAYILKMRVDREPWTDPRVRNALKKCQDRQRSLQQIFQGEGQLSIDAHMAPAHPDYVAIEIPPYDPEGSRALLAEAGYPEGLTVTLVTKNDELEPALAQALKETAAAGGFEIQLDITDPESYWSRWTEVDFGITAWSHRPLATMVLSLAYTDDGWGSPAPFNETGWIDPEFSQLLQQAETTLDLEQRQQLMGQLQQIMVERGPMGNSCWQHRWSIHHKGVQQAIAHPYGYDQLEAVWLDR